MTTNSCEDLLLTSLTQYYNENCSKKLVLKEIIDGKHKLSLRLIDWLVTHYAKASNVFYWIHKKTDEIYNTYPIHISEDTKHIKKVNLYLDYRAQLKSYAKINFDSFRRHNRITFFLNLETNEYIETTIGQLNFFRWAFNNNVLEYACQNYDKIYQHMIDNNSYKKQKKCKQHHTNIQDITKTLCTLTFD
jgi:hypothetical protein